MHNLFRPALLFALAAAHPVRAQLILAEGTDITEHFDSLGAGAPAALPSGWKADAHATTQTIGSRAAAADSTALSGGNNLASNAANGIYNFGAGEKSAATDRCPGFLASSGGTKSGNLYAWFRNGNACAVTSFTLSYTMEKYRSGANAAGFAVNLHYSFNGSSWTAAGSPFSTVFPADSTTTGYVTAPGDSVQVTATLPVTIPAGADFYLAWNYSVAAGSNTSAAQALGIDAVVVSDVSTQTRPEARHFRSAGTAAWSSAATWQSSADSLSCWQAAIAPPGAEAASVLIVTGDSITADASVTVSRLVIAAGAVLVYGDYTNSTFTVGDGPGCDFVMEGTFYDSGPANILWQGASSWKMGGAGTLVRTKGGTSSNNWRDRYDGGIAAIPATANWIIRKVDGTSPEISSTGGMHYPNLAIRNRSGVPWVTNPASSFSGFTGRPVIKGNFMVGDAAGAVDFTCSNTHALPVFVAGDVTVAAGSVLRNNGTGFDISGNLLCDGAITYDSDDGRQLVFSGGGDQIISAPGSAAIHVLAVNKTAGLLLLQDTIAADSLLELLSGIVRTSDTALLMLSDDAVVSGASHASHVSGPLLKTGAAGFTFPVGDGSVLRPLRISGLSGSASFTAAYLRADPDSLYDTGRRDTSLHHVSRCEHWTLERAGTATARVGLGWNAYSCGVDDPSALAVARWDGSAWRDHGNGGTTGGNDSGAVTTDLPVADFSPFTLASATAANPLPVELLTFAARRRNDGSVRLQWTTASETASDHFAAERSRDAVFFTDIARVPAAGNSVSERRYDVSDPRPAPGTNYYRLRQVDADGSVEYGPVVAVMVPGDEAGFSIRVQYGGEGIALLLTGPEHGVCTVQLFSAQGALVFGRKATDGYIALPPLPHGVYVVVVSGEGWRIVEKVVR